MLSRSVLCLILFVSSICASAQTSGESTQKLAWVAGSKLSLAAIVNADGMEKAVVDRQFVAASNACTSLGIKLPALPERKGNKIEDNATALNYLLNMTGNPIGGILARNFGADHAAIFEIALKSNILLMLYSPGESTSNAIANMIRTRRATAGLPNGLTDPLIALIEQKATFDRVKTEVFKLHEIAPNFIALLDLGRKGEQYYAAKDYQGSAAAFTKAIAIDPDGPENYFGRARAYMQLNRNVEAIADYSKSIQLASGTNAPRNLSIAYHNRGVCYFLTGKNQLAIGDLTQAIKLRADYASAYKVRGLVYQKMGNTKLANDDLQMAERLQPGITK